MSEDYYKILGVSKTATQDDLQKAYRDLARKYHPDMNPDDTAAATKKFQELQKAYDVLKDPEKRKMYDQFGSDFEQYGGRGNPYGAAGNPFGEGGPFQRGAQGGAHPFGQEGPFGSFGGGQGINLNDILGMFGAGGGTNPFAETTRGTGRRRKSGPVRGTDLNTTVNIPFKTAIQGGKLSLNFDRGTGKMESMDVTIPAGIENGKKIRLRGLGNSGVNGGTPGDLILTAQVDDHPYFTRQGKTLYVKVPVTLKEAALGAKIDVPTPKGLVAVTVPPGSSTGTKLRLKGYGVPGSASDGSSKSSGDLIVELQVVLPKIWSKEDQELLARIDSNLSPLPRRNLHF